MTDTPSERTAPIQVNPDDLFTLDGASHATAISTKALSTALNTGQLKGSKRARQWFILGSDLRKWLLGEDAAPAPKPKPKKAKAKRT